MKTFATRLTTLLLVGLLSAAAMARAATLDIPKEKLWLHLPMDGSLLGEPKERFSQVLLGKDDEELKRQKSSLRPQFVPGLTGQALDLPPHNLLTYRLDISDFPRRRGSLLAWFKPHEELQKTQGFLLEAHWANFDVIIAPRMTVYYTSDHRKSLVADLAKFKGAWKDQWHLFVLTWDEGKREVFVDGQKLVAADGIPLYGENGNVSSVWALGYLPSCPGRAPCAFLNASLDDFAVFSQPLSHEQVQTIWTSPGQSLLGLLGVSIRLDLPRRSYVRGETIRLKFHYERQACQLRLSAADAAGRECVLATLDPAPAEYALDTNSLRPGELRLKAELLQHGKVLDQALAEIVVHAFRRPEFAVGVGGAWKDESVLKYYRQNHVAFLTGNGPPLDFRSSLDKMYRYGIGSFPNLNVVELWGSAFNRFKEEPYFRYDQEKGQWRVSSPECFDFLQTLVPIGGKVEDGLTSSASPFSPAAFNMMSRVIQDVMERAGDHPGLQYVSFQDEVPLRFTTYNYFHRFKKGGWTDQWHCFALAWKDDRREAFFDGQSIARASGVATAPAVQPVWHFGFLPPCPGRKTSGFVNSALDDTAVLAKALDADEAATLWRQRDKSLAQLAAEMPGLAGKVWACWSFDNTLEPQPKGRAKKCVLGAAFEDLAKETSTRQPTYVPGKSGQAIDLLPENLLACTLDTTGFPTREGTLVFWFKPHEPLEAMQRRWFLYVNWASFCIQTGNQQILAYYTADSAKWLTCPEPLPAIGDYSYPAIRHFEKMTGLKGPAWPPDLPAGSVLSDAEPYLKWKDVIGLPGDASGEGFDRLYEKLSAEVKKYRPDVLATNYSGGEYGYLDAVGDWQYPYIWEPRIAGGCAGHGLLDFCLDLHRARQKVTPRKPLWALLGWWSSDLAKAPANWWPRDFRLNTEIALAKGVKLLEWFAPGDSGMDGYLGQPEGRQEFERWCAWLHRNGPVFRHLEPEPKATVAVLWSETNTAGKTRRAPNHPPRYALTLTALRIAGAEPMLVTDEMVERGALDGCGGLVLLGCDYSRQGVWKRIEDFAAQPGKTVLYDTLSALHPPKAAPLGFAADELAPNQRGSGGPQRNLQGLAYQAAGLRRAVPQSLLSGRLRIAGSDFVAPFWLAGGKARYLFLINLNWEQTQKIEFRLTPPKGDEQLYDFLSGRPAPMAGPVEIEPGAWKVYLLLPRRVGGVELQAAWTGQTRMLDVRAQLCGPDGRNLEVPLPVAVRIFAPDGALLPYTQPSAFDAHGAWKSSIRLAERMDVPGVYRIEVEELLTGQKANASVPVNGIQHLPAR